MTKNKIQNQSPSHAKSPVAQDKINCEYLAYFEPQRNSKKESKILFVKEILCNFLVRTLKYLKKYIFLSNFFFSIANRSKISSNLIICSKKWLLAQVCCHVYQIKTTFGWHLNFQKISFLIFNELSKKVQSYLLVGLSCQFSNSIKELRTQFLMSVRKKGKFLRDSATFTVWFFLL